MKRHAWAILAAALSGCDGWDGWGPDICCSWEPPVAPTCAEVFSQPWEVTGPSEFPVGESRLKGLQAGTYDPVRVCGSSVQSIAWLLSEPSVGSLVPEAAASTSRVWLTGLRTGETRLTGIVRLVDGRERAEGPVLLKIGPPAEPPGSRLIASRRLTVPEASGSYEWFDLPVSGRVDIVLDWGSPLNAVAASLFAGHCSDIGSCTVLAGPGAGPGAKPARQSLPNKAAGPYTLRVGNRGPGPEEVLYEVWLTP